MVPGRFDRDDGSGDAGAGVRPGAGDDARPHAADLAALSPQSFSEAARGGVGTRHYLEDPLTRKLLEFFDAKGLDAAFKTPSLRNAALRPPYMHAGQFANLADVVRHYVKAPAATVGHSELAHAGGRHAERQPIRLSEQDVQDVVAFLGALSGPIVERAHDEAGVR